MMMQSNRGFQHLSAIRGVAALLVFFDHFVQIFWVRIIGVESWLSSLATFAGYYSVAVFFVLSGFLITQSAEQNRHRNLTFNIGEFFASRFARLYPPFFFAVLISISIYGVMDLFQLPGRAGPLMLQGDLYAVRSVINISVREIILALLMKSGLLDINGPLWSLYMEVQLYVLFACTYWLLSKRSILSTVLALGVAVLVLRMALQFSSEFPRYAVIWLSGCCAYYLFTGEHRSTRLASLVFGMLVICITGIDFIGHTSRFAFSLTNGRMIVVDLMIASAIGWILFRYKFDRMPGQSVADYSYSLYVVHFPVMLLFQSLLIEIGSKSSVTIAGVSIVAGASALGIARLGGKLEAAKDRVQRSLMVIYNAMTTRLRSVNFSILE